MCIRKIRAKEEQKEQKRVILPVLENKNPAHCIKTVGKGGWLGMTLRQNVVVGTILT